MRSPVPLRPLLVTLGVFLPAAALAIDGAALWATREDFPGVAFAVLAFGAAAYAAQLALTARRAGLVGLALGAGALALFAWSLSVRDLGRLGIGWRYAGTAVLALLGNVLADLQVLRALATEPALPEAAPTWAPR